MEIRSTLEHQNLIPIDREQLSDQLIADLSRENRLLLVCDVSDRFPADERTMYVKALADADVIEDSNVEPVLEDTSLVIIVPFHTEQIATETYRRIKHASHFVTVYEDGKLQNEC